MVRSGSVDYNYNVLCQQEYDMSEECAVLPKEVQPGYTVISHQQSPQNTHTHSHTLTHIQYHNVHVHAHYKPHELLITSYFNC